VIFHVGKIAEWRQLSSAISQGCGANPGLYHRGSLPPEAPLQAPCKAGVNEELPSLDLRFLVGLFDSFGNHCG
jgi:hypothetical protein